MGRRAKRIIITMGDPSGIGPYITVKALSSIGLRRYDFIVVGDNAILRQVPGYENIKNSVHIIDLGNAGSCKKGSCSKESGGASLEYLVKAVEIIKDNGSASLVTAPVSKEAVSMSCKEFCGHTEFLAKNFFCREVVMLMAGRRLKVALLTRHIPLGKVPQALAKTNKIRKQLQILADYLAAVFKISSPVIGICSFNPHAGVDTYLGKEEADIIRAVSSLKKKNFFRGPYPSDTVFKKLQEYDAIVACYHDQAMIPFKLMDFSQGVNITLGLPFVRTSPGHGPAYDIVKKRHLINYGPMIEAIKFAQSLDFGS